MAGIPGATSPSAGGLPATPEAKGGGFLLKPAQMGTSGVLTILVEGTKDAGKTVNLATMPVPDNGPRRIFLTVDETCKPSLEEFYGADKLKAMNVEVYNMHQPAPDVGYSGFDPTDPKTAMNVLEQTKAALRQFRSDGDVGLLIVDHFQGLYEQIGGQFARYLATKAKGPDADIGMNHWGERTTQMNAIEWLVRQVPVDGGTAIISGYDQQEKGLVQTDTKGKMKGYVRTMQPATWLKKDIRRNWLVAVHMDETTVYDQDPRAVVDPTELSSHTIYTAEVTMSKFHPGEGDDKVLGNRWRKGRIVDLTERQGDPLGAGFVRFFADPESSDVDAASILGVTT